MTDTEAYVALNLVENLGPVKLRQLLAHFEGGPQAILNASAPQLASIPGIGMDTAVAISGWEKGVDLAGELRRITEFGCHVVIPTDPEYPPLLREDILSEFEYLFPPSNQPPSAGQTGLLPALSLSESEQKVFAVLSRTEQTTDDIVRASGLPVSAANVALFTLEMKHLARQLPGKLFVRIPDAAES